MTVSAYKNIIPIVIEEKLSLRNTLSFNPKQAGGGGGGGGGGRNPPTGWFFPLLC